MLHTLRISIGINRSKPHIQCLRNKRTCNSSVVEIYRVGSVLGWVPEIRGETLSGTSFFRESKNAGLSLMADCIGTGFPQFPCAFIQMRCSIGKNRYGHSRKRKKGGRKERRKYKRWVWMCIRKSPYKCKWKMMKRKILNFSFNVCLYAGNIIFMLRRSSLSNPIFFSI